MADPFDDVAALGVRLANLRTDEGPALGAERGDGVLDVTAAGRRFGLPAPRDMDDLLQSGAGAAVRAILERADADGEVMTVPLAQARFAPLVTRPEKILCVGFNYREHAEETGTPIPKAPPLFSKFANALNHHGGTVALPTKVDDRFDYETELVIVFGRACRDVPEESALDVVAGYAVGDDLSARRLQTQTSQFLAGKACDGFAPVGPWLAPRALVPDPNALRLKTELNGEVRQDWTTKDMIFGCRRLIAFVTSLMTMKPGDLLFTGTPQGVIFGQKAPPEERRWLRSGDVVRSTIEGLGTLEVTLR